MTLIRPREIREMDLETRVSKLKALRADLMHERGVAAMGGAPPSPGKIRALRKSINRLITIMKEEEKIARGEKKVPKEAAK